MFLFTNTYACIIRTKANIWAVGGVVRRNTWPAQERGNMGKTDILAREYLSDKSRFADAFNYLLYDGRTAIVPEDLSPLDTAGVVASTQTGGRAKPTQKARDTLKAWQVMEGGEAAYAILALEEQTNVHRGMSARCMLYDAMSYDAQLKAIAKRNRASGMKGVSGGDFLAGILPEDVITPVVTLVLYLNSGDWDAPESLHGLMGEAGEEILGHVPD